MTSFEVIHRCNTLEILIHNRALKNANLFKRRNENINKNRKVRKFKFYWRLSHKRATGFSLLNFTLHLHRLLKTKISIK
jgi:hypothetical protein